MKQRTCKSLCLSATANRLWRFWPASDSKTYFLPLDCDDTACANLLLQEPMPAHSREILLANRNSRGLFYTWIFPRSETFFKPAIWKLPFSEYPGFLRYLYVWKKTEASPGDIDAAVNANMLACLGEGDYALSVVQWLKQILEQGSENTHDKWYEPLMTHYMIARAITCGPQSMQSLKDPLKKRILEEMNSPHLGALASPIAVSSLLHLAINDDHLDVMMTRILEGQATDGSWPAAPAFRGGPKRLSFWGGRVLTTAFSLEAISLYLKLQSPEKFFP